MSFWNATAYITRSITSKLVVALLIIVIITFLKESGIEISPAMMRWELPPDLIQAGFFATMAVTLAVSTQVH
jgi:hypothetical protein